MPVVFTPLGDTLEAAVIDGNIEQVEQLLRGLILEGDITGDFRRWRIMQYTSGRIVAAHTFANPDRPVPQTKRTKHGLTGAALERFDITYRQKLEDCGLIADAQARAHAIHRAAYEMELFGRPGPSFFYSFQEDGYDPTVALAGVAGWPPGGWPLTRYPQEYCFSRWLTCPGASVKVWVPRPCIARIHGMAKVSTDIWHRIWGMASFNRPDLVGLEIGALARFALVVDTNPNLHDDEFTNTNPNIVDPQTGVMSPVCSWQIIRDRTLIQSQRHENELWGEVALKGGRFYNFSLKMTDAMTHGWVDRTAPATWDGLNSWESQHASAAPNAPQSVLSVLAQDKQFRPLWISLWENCSMNVEFVYGRDEAYVTDSEDPEFQFKA